MAHVQGGLVIMEEGVILGGIGFGGHPNGQADEALSRQFHQPVGHVTTQLVQICVSRHSSSCCCLGGPDYSRQLPTEISRMGVVDYPEDFFTFRTYDHEHFHTIDASVMSVGIGYFSFTMWALHITNSCVA